MTEIIVFIGPTLTEAEVVEALPGAATRGPAARGDVYRACAEKPCAIALVDGYFEHRAAVTHKEILWALKQGVAVYGAASMGALRAAELARFGVIGCGSIFAALASGVLEDDDEVAVAHAGAEYGYRAGSEAMVNFRATLAAAFGAGVASETDCADFLRVAKALFYPERSYRRVLHELGADGARDRWRGLFQWLEDAAHRIDQKRLDALEMLRSMRRHVEAGELPRPRADWTLPETSSFRELREQCRAAPSALARAVIEEVQLLGPEVYAEILSSASLRALALSLGEANSSFVPSAHDEASLAAEERRVLARMPDVQAVVLAQFEPVLRALGDYERVAARATAKQLACRELQEGAPREARRDIAEYFRAVIRRPEPHDLEAFARAAGFGAVSDFVTAVERELAFLRRASTEERS